VVADCWDAVIVADCWEAVMVADFSVMELGVFVSVELPSVSMELPSVPVELVSSVELSAANSLDCVAGA